jgi:hypothetical protein
VVVNVVNLSVFIVIFLTLTGCAGKKAGDTGKAADRLTGEAVQQLLAGSKIHLVEYDGAADITLAEDGTATAVNNDHQKDTGLWRVDDQGRFCLKFKKWSFSDKTCYEVYPKNENTFRLKVQPGGYAASMTVEGAEVSAGAAHPVAQRQGEENVPVSEEESENKDHPEVSSSQQEEKDTYGKEDVRYILTMMVRDCPGCNLQSISLPGADLSGAELSGANLSGADLTGARLRNAHLQKADLSRSKLMDADLSGADLRGADLFGADLTGARLNGANLEGAGTVGAKGLPQQ